MLPDAPPVAETVKSASPYVLVDRALNVITCGSLGMKVNPDLTAVESKVEISISPVVPLSTTAVTVFPSTMLKDFAALPPKVTPVAHSKLVPVMVTVSS